MWLTTCNRTIQGDRSLGTAPARAGSTQATGSLASATLPHAMPQAAPAGFAQVQSTPNWGLRSGPPPPEGSAQMRGAAESRTASLSSGSDAGARAWGLPSQLYGAPSQQVAGQPMNAQQYQLHMQQQQRLLQQHQYHQQLSHYRQLLPLAQTNQQKQTIGIEILKLQQHLQQLQNH